MENSNSTLEQMASFLLSFSLFILLKALLKAQTIHQSDVLQYVCYYSSGDSWWVRLWLRHNYSHLERVRNMFERQHWPQYKYFPFPTRMKFCALQLCNFWHLLNCKYGEYLFDVQWKWRSYVYINLHKGIASLSINSLSSVTTWSLFFISVQWPPSDLLDLLDKIDYDFI